MQIHLIDFHYSGVEIDYDTATNCTDYECNPYCRCGRIVNARVIEIDPTGMALQILSKLKGHDKRAKDPLFQYCLERVCSTYDEDDFEVNSMSGYYGEEIQSVTLNDVSAIDTFLRIQHPSKWVEAALKAEYGHLLEKLEGLKWEIVKLPLQEVKVGNEYRKLNRDTLQRYEDTWKYTRGQSEFLSCLCDADMNLIDGGHRLQASKNKGKRKIWVVRPCE